MSVQTETLWQQITGGGIVGAGAGRQLEFVPSQIVSFDEFRQAFPDALVLNEDTGSQIVYGVICGAGGFAMYFFARDFRRTRTSYSESPASDDDPPPHAGGQAAETPAPPVEVR